MVFPKLAEFEQAGFEQMSPPFEPEAFFSNQGGAEHEQLLPPLEPEALFFESRRS